MSKYAMMLAGPGATARVGHVVRTVEVGAAAYAVSMASVRLGGAGGKTLAGFPLELAAGALLFAGAAMGAGGPRFSGDLMNFADGCIAAYMAKQGQEMGAKAAASGYEIGAGENEFLRRQAGLPV